MKICPLAKDCPHENLPGDNCPHKIPHKAEKSCPHGYDTEPDKEYCCPSCIPSMPTWVEDGEPHSCSPEECPTCKDRSCDNAYEDFIENEEMTL